MAEGHARTPLDPVQVFGDIACAAEGGERQLPRHNGVGVLGVSISEWTFMSSSITIPLDSSSFLPSQHIDVYVVFCLFICRRVVLSLSSGPCVTQTYQLKVIAGFL